MKMPAELKEKWVAALRSGKYGQVADTLCDGSGNYCCLGVLEDVAEGRIETASPVGNTTTYLATPSASFYERNNISVHLVTKLHQLVRDADVDYLTSLNDELDEEIGEHMNNFSSIADWIEKNIEAAK